MTMKWFEDKKNTVVFNFGPEEYKEQKRIFQKLILLLKEDGILGLSLEMADAKNQLMLRVSGDTPKENQQRFFNLLSENGIAFEKNLQTFRESDALIKKSR